MARKKKPSKYIGVIYVKESKEIRAVLNPAYDWQLFDPSHLFSDEEERELLKLPRENFPEVATIGHIPVILEKANIILKGI